MSDHSSNNWAVLDCKHQHVIGGVPSGGDITGNMTYILVVLLTKRLPDGKKDIHAIDDIKREGAYLDKWIKCQVRVWITYLGNSISNCSMARALSSSSSPWTSSNPSSSSCRSSLSFESSISSSGMLERSETLKLTQVPSAFLTLWNRQSIDLTARLSVWLKQHTRLTAEKELLGLAARHSVWYCWGRHCH